MANSTTRVKYDELILIAKHLHAESEEYAALHSLTRRKLNALHYDWNGVAAESFFNEMNDKVLPAVQRLSTALLISGDVLNQIQHTIYEADRETTGYFKGLESGEVNSANTLSGGLPTNNNMPSLSWLGGKPHLDIFKGQEGFVLENSGNGGSFEPGKLEKKLEIKIGTDGQLHDGGSYQVGKWDYGMKVGIGEKGLSIGPYGEFDIYNSQNTQVGGSTMFGFTRTITDKAISVEGFAGIKDYTLGATVGGTLASREYGLGVNIAGINIGINGSVGIGIEYGFKIGKETEISLGPIKFGLSFGEALVNTPTAQ